jgi:ketosteroid isomerase-like protein
MGQRERKIFMSKLSDQDVAAIRVWLDKYVDLCLKADWDKVLDMLTDDVVHLPPNEPLIEGKKAAGRWLNEFPPIKTFETQLAQADGRDDFAWARGVYNMGVEPEPGNSLSMIGKWSLTFRKQPDGSWLMASDTWNHDEPPTAS